jgi:hypothetical protein
MEQHMFQDVSLEPYVAHTSLYRVSFLYELTQKHVSISRRIHHYRSISFRTLRFKVLGRYCVARSICTVYHSKCTPPISYPGSDYVVELRAFLAHIGLGQMLENALYLVYGIFSVKNSCHFVTQEYEYYEQLIRETLIANFDSRRM